MSIDFPTVLTGIIGEYAGPIPWIDEGKVEKKALVHINSLFGMTKISKDIVVSGSWDNTIRVWRWKEE